MKMIYQDQKAVLEAQKKGQNFLARTYNGNFVEGVLVDTLHHDNGELKTLIIEDVHTETPTPVDIKDIGRLYILERTITSL